jgi:hypothetical protein
MLTPQEADQAIYASVDAAKYSDPAIVHARAAKLAIESTAAYRLQTLTRQALDAYMQDEGESASYRRKLDEIHSLLIQASPTARAEWETAEAAVAGLPR